MLLCIPVGALKCLNDTITKSQILLMELSLSTKIPCICSLITMSSSKAIGIKSRSSASFSRQQSTLLTSSTAIVFRCLIVNSLKFDHSEPGSSTLKLRLTFSSSSESFWRQAPRRSQKNCDPAIKVGYRFEVCDQVAITPSFPRAISREKPSPCDLRDQSECCGCD